MPLSGREAALKALISYRKTASWSENYLDGLIEKENIDKREAALAFQLCLGVIQNETLCDYYINCFSTLKSGKADALISDIIRMGVYQLLFLDRVPRHAAVNEAVLLAKKYANPGAVRYVNAILRKISDNSDALPRIDRTDIAEYLAVKYSHPKWFVSRMLARLGETQCEELLKANNSAPMTHINANTLKGDADDILTSIKEHCSGFRICPVVPNCIEISGAGKLSELDAFKNGLVYVQDPAAKIAAMTAGAKPGMTVIDACSAPGGKSFAMAMTMENRGKIISCDINKRKLDLVSSGAEKLGIDIITTRLLDGRECADEFIEYADVVVADVPCSGFGVIRKKPDIRWKNEKDIAGLPAIQLDIINNLAKYVKPGGVLLYSTCTVFSEENEDVIRSFLGEHGDFSTEMFTMPVTGEIVENGMKALWPHLSDTDGFFICKLRRKG